MLSHTDSENDSRTGGVWVAAREIFLSACFTFWGVLLCVGTGVRMDVVATKTPTPRVMFTAIEIDCSIDR